MASIIYDGSPSAFPHTFEYTPERDTPGMLMISGSAWTKDKDTTIGLTLIIDEKIVTRATLWSNGPNTHRALNAGLKEYTFKIDIENQKIKPVKITIGRLNDLTQFDVNDQVTVTLF